MRHLVAVSLVGLAIVVGCSSSDDKPSSNTSSSSSSGDTSSSSSSGSTAGPVTTTVTAAAGGTLEAPGAKVAVPPGAVAADTTLTATTLDKAAQPSPADIGGAVYDFGPNGTTFLKPVTLTFDVNASAPEGKKAVIAFLKDGKWEALPDSAVSGTTVTATTTHFTPYTVVFTAAGQTGGACAGTFNACGGDLVGTWKYTGACIQAKQNPVAGQCPTATFSATIDQSGQITFKGDNTYTQAGTTKLTTVIEYPESCVTQVQGDCSKLVSAGSTATAEKTATGCKVTDSQPPKVNEESGTYTIANNAFTLTATGEQPDRPIQFCIQGTALRAKSEDDKSISEYTATKQ